MQEEEAKAGAAATKERAITSDFMIHPFLNLFFKR
jgi:hypothetical protein